MATSFLTLKTLKLANTATYLASALLAFITESRHISKGKGKKQLSDVLYHRQDETEGMEDHLMTTNKLVDRVLGWLDKKPTKESRNKIYFYLDDTIPAWHRLVGTITPQNLSLVHHKLDTMKEKILRECCKNKELMDGLPDLKTTSCPGKIAELNMKVKTSSGSNISSGSQRRLGGGAKNFGNNLQAQMEKWTSNLTKSKERKTYKANMVSINLPKEPKGLTGRKKSTVTYVEASQQTEELATPSKLKETNNNLVLVPKSTRFEDAKMVERSDKPEIEATAMLPPAEDLIPLARPNTPVIHVRGESRKNDAGLSDTGQKKVKEKQVKQEKCSLDAGVKNSSPAKWKWHLTVPPPTPESDTEYNKGN